MMTIDPRVEFLQIDELPKYKLTRSGQIPFFKIAGQWRLRKDIIDKWISEVFWRGYFKI